MAHFRIFTSNRLEILIEYLAQVIDEPLKSPLEPEIIVVQSKGMQRWISIKLSKKFGICANTRFPYLNAIIEELIHNILPNLPNRNPFEIDILSFRILQCIPSLIDESSFFSLKNYLGVDNSISLKSYQLAERLARIFDQYIMFRPDWILEWEKGEKNHWQAKLWQEISKEIQSPHKAIILKMLLDALDGSQRQLETLPKRISIFGIPAIPPMHMEIFVAIAKYIDINLFLMNPCQEYWYDIVSIKEASKVLKKQKDVILSAEELYFETGHPLLSSLGKQGAYFFDKILNIQTLEEKRDFYDPGDKTLLSCIASDILNLKQRGAGIYKKKTIASNDLSIQIHVCHSPMREIEVLYDYLLDLFEKNNDLSPYDILVMTPNIDTYAPFISAVFDGCHDPEKKIPYSLADRNAKTEGQIINLFFKILNLSKSRFKTSEVMDILEAPPIRERFGLTTEDMIHIKRWIDDTHICWGINREDRVRAGLPDFEENSWMAGLSRLLLGYALPAGEERMFANILPYDDIEGSSAKVFGLFIDFIKNLIDYVSYLKMPRTLSSWSRLLNELTLQFFNSDESRYPELQILQGSFSDLINIERLSGFNREIDIKVLSAYLTNRLERHELKKGFLTGGVSFCTMLPMRSIPFRIIAQIGMNDSEFPRITTPAGFDLMTKYPKRGDPSKRDEDRYLFLESLLSARVQFYISYVGHSIKDNSKIPPSVVVSELIDTIDKGFLHPDKAILDHVVINHHLQAFNPGYFKKNGHLFSYSFENYHAVCAQNKADKSDKDMPFIKTPLCELPKEEKTIFIDQLCRFFSNPARFFLQHRLGIRLYDISGIWEDKEPFELVALEKYKLKQTLAGKTLRGININDLYPIVQARGILPPGAAGEIEYNDITKGVFEFTSIVRQHTKKEELAPLLIDLKFDDFRVIGKINSIYSDNLLRYRCANLKAKDSLNIWIEHLLLNSLNKSTYPKISLLIGADYKRYFDPVPDADKILKELLFDFWSGMQTPLPFFPETSWNYVQKIHSSCGDSLAALNEGLKSWEGNSFGKMGDLDDPYIKLCFGKIKYPLDENFIALSLEILNPLFNSSKKLKFTE